MSFALLVLVLLLLRPFGAGRNRLCRRCRSRGDGPHRRGFVVLVTLAVVDPHLFGRRHATSCRQNLAHPRQEACILRRFVIDRADGCCNQIELRIGREVFG